MLNDMLAMVDIGMHIEVMRIDSVMSGYYQSNVAHVSSDNDRGSSSWKEMTIIKSDGND